MSTGAMALLPTGRCGSESDAGSSYPTLDSEGLCGKIPDGQWFPGVSDGAYWQLVTSMFAHVQIWHIGFNLLVLFLLGPQIEAVLGRVRFLALYLVSGLAGSVAVYWLSGEDTATLGASGAIFGLLGALLVVALKVRGNVQSILTWLAVNAAFTLLVPGISWQGHLGGFLGGMTVTAILVYAPRERRVLVQLGGVALVVVALLAATVVRSAVLA